MTWNNQNCAEKGAKITLLALYEKTIYQNEKNGFCIFRMTSEDTGIPISCRQLYRGITKNKKRDCSIPFLRLNQRRWESNGGFNCSKVRDRYTGCD